MGGMPSGMVTQAQQPPRVEAALVRAFAPMHKRALGVAVGVTAALGVFLLTAFHVVTRPEGIRLELLSVYFYGYDVTWRGAFVGAWWAFVGGFVAGWFTAFMRNVAVAIRLTVLRVRFDLEQTRSFLDHI
jgi:hypothetical protein